MEKDRAVLIFCRNEIPGRVKTRLAAAVGEERAMDIYRKLCDHAADICSAADAVRVVCYDSYLETTDRWDGCADERWLQQGDDLGARREDAVSRAFHQGYAKVILIGTDCPQLTSPILESAFAELDSNEVVIGPAEDGGFYLLALKSVQPEFFRNKNWGTESVLAETIANAARLGLRYTLLPVLRDVDTAADAYAFGL